MQAILESLPLYSWMTVLSITLTQRHRGEQPTPAGLDGLRGGIEANGGLDEHFTGWLRLPGLAARHHPADWLLRQQPSARPARWDARAGRRAYGADDQADKSAEQESDDMRQVGYRPGARGGIAR